MDSSTHRFFSFPLLLRSFSPSDWHFYFEVTLVHLYICVRARVFVHMDVVHCLVCPSTFQKLSYNHSTPASLTPSPVQETLGSSGSISVPRSDPPLFCCHLNLNLTSASTSNHCRAWTSLTKALVFVICSFCFCFFKLCCSEWTECSFSVNICTRIFDFKWLLFLLDLPQFIVLLYSLLKSPTVNFLNP